MMESLRGTQLFKTLMILSLYAFLVVMMFLMMIDKMLIIPCLVVLAFWLFALWVAQREMTIKVLRKYAGKKVLVGTLDEEEDMGEVVEFKINRIVRFQELTNEERSKIGNIKKKEEDLMRKFEKSIDSRYILLDEPKQKEVKKIESKSKNQETS